VNFFLKKFPNLEWSGPAWYEPCYEDGEQFPTGFNLIHFHPLDLGHGSTTAVEGQDIATILEKTYKKYPDTEKCMMGLIHSHHSMGAFFSGTDDKNMEEMAPLKNFYCSTVVASKKDPYSFGISYQDQYGLIHLVKADEDDIEIQVPKTKALKEWAEISDKITKKKETEKKSYTPGYNYNQAWGGNYGYYNGSGAYNQGHLFGRDGWGKTKKVGVISNDMYAEDEQVFITKLKSKETQFEQLDMLVQAMLKNEIQWFTFSELTTEMGYDPAKLVNTYLEKIENEEETLKKSGLDTTKFA